MTVTVTLSEQEAQALARGVEFGRIALDGVGCRVDAGSVMATAHARLIHALEVSSVDRATPPTVDPRPAAVTVRAAGAASLSPLGVRRLVFNTLRIQCLHVRIRLLRVHRAWLLRPRRTA